MNISSLNQHVEPKKGHYEDCTEFMEWLIDAVTNEHKWQSYQDVYGEIICRKLKELGLIKEVDGYYTGFEKGKEQKWIPVSERLPEKDGWYLCAVGSSYMPIRTMCYAPNEWRKDDQNTWKDTYGYYVFNWFVVAWMPLPKPYEGDKQ